MFQQINYIYESVKGVNASSFCALYVAVVNFVLHACWTTFWLDVRRFALICVANLLTKTERKFSGRAFSQATKKIRKTRFAVVVVTTSCCVKKGPKSMSLPITWICTGGNEGGGWLRWDEKPNHWNTYAKERICLNDVSTTVFPSSSKTESSSC